MLELILWPLLTNLLNHEPLEKFKALIELFWKKRYFLSRIKWAILLFADTNHFRSHWQVVPERVCPIK